MSTRGQKLSPSVGSLGWAVGNAETRGGDGLAWTSFLPWAGEGQVWGRRVHTVFQRVQGMIREGFQCDTDHRSDTLLTLLASGVKEGPRNTRHIARETGKVPDAPSCRHLLRCLAPPTPDMDFKLDSFQSSRRSRVAEFSWQPSVHPSPQSERHLDANKLRMRSPALASIAGPQVPIGRVIATAPSLHKVSLVPSIHCPQSCLPLCSFKSGQAASW